MTDKKKSIYDEQYKEDEDFPLSASGLQKKWQKLMEDEKKKAVGNKKVGKQISKSFMAVK